jgi:hypothetical protein
MKNYPEKDFPLAEDNCLASYQFHKVGTTPSTRSKVWATLFFLIALFVSFYWMPMR